MLTCRVVLVRFCCTLHVKDYGSSCISWRACISVGFWVSLSIYSVSIRVVMVLVRFWCLLGFAFVPGFNVCAFVILFVYSMLLPVTWLEKRCFELVCVSVGLILFCMTV